MNKSSNQTGLRYLWSFLALTAVYLFFLNPVLDVREFNAHDPSSYLRRAQAFWQGFGHGEIFENISLKATIQMPGFPFLIAPLVGIFGFNFVVLKLFMIFLAGILFFVAHKFFKIYLEENHAILATFFLMTSPVVFGLSHRVLADMPVMIPVLLGIVFLNRYLEEEKPILSKELGFTGICLVTGYFLKPIALGVMAGGGLLFLHSKYRTRKVFVKLAICTALILPFMIMWSSWCKTVPPYWYWSMPPSDFFMRATAEVDSDFATYADFFMRFRNNVVWGGAANIGAAILTPLYFFRGHVVAFLISVPIVIGVAVLWVRYYVKKPTVMEGFILFEILLLLLKPQGLAIRYSVIFYPVLIIYLFRLIKAINKPAFSRLVVASLFALSCASTVTAGVIQLKDPYGSEIVRDYVKIAEQTKTQLPIDSTCYAPLITHWQIMTDHLCYIKVPYVPETMDWKNGPDYYVFLSPQNLAPAPETDDIREDLYKQGLKLREELAGMNRPYDIFLENESFTVIKFKD